MVGALPRIHELAAQAGIELPAALGKLGERMGKTEVVNGDAAPAKHSGRA